MAISWNDIKAAIDDIAAGCPNGIATPEAIVSAASDPVHVLHSKFNWNDTTAAHQYRLDQARKLVAEIRYKFSIDNAVIPAIAYVRNPKANAREQGYKAVSTIKRQSEEARQVVAAELNRIEACINRARNLAMVLGLSTYFEAMLQTLVEARNKLQKKPARKSKV